MRGDFDWQASSNGRKYLSASMKFAFGGAAVPSLGQTQRIVKFSKHVYHSKLHFLFFLNLKENNAKQHKNVLQFSCIYFLKQRLIFFKNHTKPILHLFMFYLIFFVSSSA